MADFARQLIAKAVDEEDLLPAMNAGIKPTWFEDPEHARVWRWMLEYQSRYGVAPTFDAFEHQFPAYRLPRVREPYAYYLDHFREQRTRTLLYDSVIDADEALQGGDNKRAQSRLSRGLQQIGQEVHALSDVDAVRRPKSRYESYQERAKNFGKLYGIPSGFTLLDNVTGGWQNEQFVVLGGTAKQAKSFLLMRWAMAAQDAGYKVLFMTFEMSKEEQLARWDGIASSVNARHILQGNLTKDEFKKLRRGMGSRRNLVPFIISADLSASTTVSGLAAKVEQHRPDLICVDGAYLMESEAGVEKLTAAAFTSISRGLKRLAQSAKKPVLATIQALPGKMKDNRVTLGSLGWTSAWAQDADIILGIESIPETPSTKKLRVVAGRSIATCELTVECNFHESIFEEGEFQSDDDY